MNSSDEDRIDVRLRGVSVPRHLADGIRIETLFDDDALDRLLAQVDPPRGLIDNLRAAVSTPRPRGRRQGPVDLERLAGTRRRILLAPRRSRLGRGLAAALTDSLAVATVLGLVASLVLASVELSRQLASAPANAPRRPVVTAQIDKMAPRQPPAAPAVVAVAPAADPGDDAFSRPEDSRTAAGDLAAAAVPADARSAEDASPPHPAARGATAVRGAATGFVLPRSTGESGLRLVRECDVPGESLRRVPRTPGYDIGFEMAHGEQPLVFPAAAPRLATDRPPLSLRTDSFDRLCFEDGPGRWAAGLRAEHVLAALPAPAFTGSGGPLPARPSAQAAAVRVDLRAVDSLRIAPRRSVLVEIAATAMQPGGADHDPVNATFVLDRSVGVDPLAWRWMCRGLAAVAGEMGKNDRLSLIVGGGVPQLALRAGDAAAVASLAAQLEQQKPLPATADLDAAVRAARALDDPHGLARLVVVAHAATLDRSRAEAHTAVTAWQTALAECGGEPLAGRISPAVPRIVVVDAATSAEPSFGRTPADPVAIRRAMVRQLLDRDTLAARQCHLDVSFDPRQVAAYRLVGHRQSTFESLSTESPPAVDLHSGETVRAVYEVFPEKAFGKGAVVATLRFRRVGDDRACEVKSTLTALPGKPAATIPPQLRELQLAAALGDAAGGSPHLDARMPAAARALAAEWKAHGDVSALGSRLIECIERGTGDRRGPR